MANSGQWRYQKDMKPRLYLVYLMKLSDLLIKIKWGNNITPVWKDLQNFTFVRQ